MSSISKKKLNQVSLMGDLGRGVRAGYEFEEGVSFLGAGVSQGVGGIVGGSQRILRVTIPSCGLIVMIDELYSAKSPWERFINLRKVVTHWIDPIKVRQRQNYRFCMVAGS